MFHWILCIQTLFFIFVCRWIYKWMNPFCDGKLPPGSMGFPILGETISFFSKSRTMDVHPFIKSRSERYGPIFKTSLVGLPMVVTTDAEFSHFVLQQEKLFKSWYPDSFFTLFGEQNMGRKEGAVFKYLKSLVFKIVGPENLKERLIHELQATVKATLSSWEKERSFDLKEATESMIFNFMAKRLISYDPSKDDENLRKGFSDFMNGLISFPINIRGTSFNKCLKGRKKIMEALKRELDARCLNNSIEKEENDFLDILVNELGKENPTLTEAMALDLLFLLLFASFETTSLAITFAMKLLGDHQDILQKLVEEHELICSKRDNPDSDITWEEFKSMTFTFQVINETLRVANIAPIIFRRAATDIEIKGYKIPKGWGVVISLSTTHLNPEIHESPSRFDPWRWKNNLDLGSKNFMAFGGGMRLCIGADFFKMLTSIFLHHLVMKYRWIATKEADIVHAPGLKFPNGFNIQLLAKNL